MYTNSQRRADERTKKLRNQAGNWLRELRQARGLSQFQLAQKVGVRYYATISQLEHGRGRVPPDRYLVWADALGVNAREFVRGLMSYYDPVTYEIVFGHNVPQAVAPRKRSARRTDGAQSPDGHSETARLSSPPAIGTALKAAITPALTAAGSHWPLLLRGCARDRP
jgi:transcriptional regulator with XRE-family HTH domain